MTRRLRLREIKSWRSDILSSWAVLSFISVLLVFLLWLVSTNLGWVNPLFIPSPEDVWSAFLEILRLGYKNRPLTVHIFSSLWRLSVAFVLVLVTAVPLGLVSGYLKPVQAMLDPFIEFYRPLPPLAYYTLLVVWLGSDMEVVVRLKLLPDIHCSHK